MAMALIRLTPLVASTSLLVANFDQVHVFRAWLSPSIYTSTSHQKISSHWCTVFLDRLIIMLVAIYLALIFSAAANVYIRIEGDEAARRWYALNLVFTLLHLVPAGKEYANLTSIRNRGGDGITSLKGMERWLAVNTVRFWTSDFPAFLSALIATSLIVPI